MTLKSTITGNPALAQLGDFLVDLISDCLLSGCTLIMWAAIGRGTSLQTFQFTAIMCRVITTFFPSHNRKMVTTLTDL